MKTLSIKNPWAYLIAGGLKDIENRTWRTSHRGKILIHASQKIDSRFRDMSALFTPSQWQAMSIECQRKCVCGIFESSAIIGETEIIDCVTNSSSIWAEEGQWHWVLANSKMYGTPIRNVKGALSLWEYGKI